VPGPVAVDLDGLAGHVEYIDLMIVYAYVRDRNTPLVRLVLGNGRLHVSEFSCSDTIWLF
jgi:hypothetical protein